MTGHSTLAPSPPRQDIVDNSKPNPAVIAAAHQRASSRGTHIAAAVGSSTSASAAAAAAPHHRTPLSIKPSTTPAPPGQPQLPQQPQPQQRTALPPINKMAMSSVISPNPIQEAPKMSMTSKEWVIPPRPKPGRKPATDTPPTKRKAQNRAAQRAFRERRAARVGELEEQLDAQRDIWDKTEQELKDKVHELELDVQSFRSRCMLLDNLLDRERQERIRAETEAETLKRRLEESNEFQNRTLSSSHHPFDGIHSPTGPSQRHSLTDGRSLDRQSGHSFSISQIISPPEALELNSPHDLSEINLTCGNCSPNGRCACAEDVVASVTASCGGKCGLGASCQCLDDVAESINKSQDLKRSASPLANSSNEKRHRSSSGNDDVETDFTSLFTRRMNAVSQESQYSAPSLMGQVPSIDAMAFRDGCGFCKDGTYCVCADTSLATPAMTPNDTLPPISQQVQTPPPSETDVAPTPLAMEMTADGAVKLPPRRQTQNQPSKRGGCGPNGPGTCAQCQSDPKSGLFCRLMAANFDRKGGAAGGCCGGKGADGGCCKAPKKEKINLPSLPSLGLSCAEAYQTLSSHRNFDKAQDDIGSWLPKLKATPSGGARPAPPGRMMPIEVEAASIMSVLKDFDVRFGRGF